jgi:hypothetical protein
MNRCNDTTTYSDGLDVDVGQTIIESIRHRIGGGAFVIYDVGQPYRITRQIQRIECGIGLENKATMGRHEVCGKVEGGERRDVRTGKRGPGRKRRRKTQEARK